MAHLHDHRADERAHLTQFLASLPVAPAGAIEFGDRPDLVIATPSHRIGIEHTQLFREKDSTIRPFPKEAETLEDRCIARAKDLFEARGGPPLHVHPWFTPRPMRKREVEGHAVVLAAAVACISALVAGPQRHVEAWSYNRWAPAPLPQVVEDLWVIDAVSQGSWGARRASGIATLAPERIQAAIDGKSGKAEEYRRRCDELWLLIVSDGFSPGTDLRLPEDIELECFTSSFDRVFYFSNFSQAVLELANALGTSGSAANGR